MQAFANIFSGDVWGRLNASESTKDFKNDPEFVKKIEMIQQNPQLAAQFMTDKKVMSAVAVLLGLDVYFFIHFPRPHFYCVTFPFPFTIILPYYLILLF